MSEQAVRQVVQNYIDGTFNADIELLKSCFHEKAVMTGYLGDQLLMATPAAFIEDIAGGPSMKSEGHDYKAEITHVSVTGPVADAVLYETGFKGSGTLEDHFQLLKIDGEWKIVAKNFTTIG